MSPLPKPARPRTADDGCLPVRAILRPKAVRAYAPLFKALGDETRLEILALLAAARGPLCVCDLEAQFDLTQPTVSHHLKVLRESGLVSAERKGSWVYYAVSETALVRMAEFQALMAAAEPSQAAPEYGVPERPVRIRVGRRP